MSKKDEALKLALEALEHEAEIGNDDAYRRERDVIREALADSALERMAENERELGLDYMEPEQQPYAQTAAYIKSTTNGRMHVDPVTGDVSIGKMQSAQQQEPVAWADMDVRGEDKGLSWTPGHFHKTPLYTTTPQRKPLTEKRIEELYSFWVVDCQDIVGFARAVERTVKGEA